MDLSKQQQNIDRKVCLKLLKNKEGIFKTQKINLKDYYVIFSSRQQNIGYYDYGFMDNYPTVSFDTVLQSFTDPERPTEEEFVMFKLQYGVDWIVEPLELSSEGTTK